MRVVQEPVRTIILAWWHQSSPASPGWRLGFAGADIVDFASHRGRRKTGRRNGAFRKGLATNPLVHFDLSLRRSQPHRYCTT